MFDLDKEAQSWCESIHPRGKDREAKIAELRDHLYCEIERLRSEGLADEAAFRAATELLGNMQDLRREHAKNRSLGSRFCTPEDEYLAEVEDRKPSGNPKIVMLRIIAVFFSFAAVVILSDYLTEGMIYRDTIREWALIIWAVGILFLKPGASCEACSLRNGYESVQRRVSGLIRRG